MAYSAYTSPLPTGPPVTSYTTGSYAPPPTMYTTGSYAPPVAVPMGPPVTISRAVGSTTYAAPVLSGSYVPPVSGSYTAPPMMTVSGSYAPPVSGSYTAAPPTMLPVSGSLTAPVGAPFLASAVPQMMAPGAPLMVPAGGSYSAPPPRGGLPDPETVAKQKNAYKAALDKQFQQALKQIEAQKVAVKQVLRQNAQQQKDQFSMQARSQLEAKKFELDTQQNTQLIMLQETAMQHRKILEEKAAALTLDYQQRKASEDLMMKQYAIQKQFVDNEMRLSQEFQRKQAALVQSASNPKVQAATEGS